MKFKIFNKKDRYILRFDKEGRSDNRDILISEKAMLNSRFLRQFYQPGAQTVIIPMYFDPSLSPELVAIVVQFLETGKLFFEERELNSLLYVGNFLGATFRGKDFFQAINEVKSIQLEVCIDRIKQRNGHFMTYESVAWLLAHWINLYRENNWEGIKEIFQKFSQEEWVYLFHYLEPELNTYFPLEIRSDNILSSFFLFLSRIDAIEVIEVMRSHQLFDLVSNQALFESLG